MNKTLGLDLGTNSLGWAILDDVTCDVLDKGVVVFPEGVDLDAGTSTDTPAATRRAARMARRMKFRRKLRKWQLLKVLIAAKMCPLKDAELAAWKNKGIYPLSNKDFLEWLKATDKQNPYCDRNAAAEGKVSPFVLGRALYHICQRRGFKSSRKEEAAAVDAETGEVIADDKKLGAVKSDIAALTKEIADSGAKTLGQYFFRRLEEDKDSIAKSRIRCRYTGRVEHYLHEFEVLMSVQHVESKLAKKLHNAIFYQRPLRSQSFLVGKCPLEKDRPRAQIGHPVFEEYRMWAFINNLTLEDADGAYRDDDGNALYPLTAEDRELISTAFMKASPSMKFSAISKLFKKDERFAKRKMKFHYYSDDDSVPTCRTRHLIRSNFGDISYDEQKVFDALTFFDDTEKLVAWFKRHYPALDEKSVSKLVRVHPADGNANYSLKAIGKMLPFLRKGYDLAFSRFCAKLPDVMSDFENRGQDILEHLAAQTFEYRAARRRYGELASSVRKVTPKPPMLFDRYRLVLEEYGLTEEGWNRLYLNDGEEYVPENAYVCKGKTVRLKRPRIPSVRLGMIRNPLVQRSMTTLRRLVNYLGDHGKIDRDDTIRIELARTVNDFATRKAIQNRNKAREAMREKAAAEIAKLGVKVTDDALERYMLWEEQGHRCLYTGKNIPVKDLFSGNIFDVEHTLPRSLSGDDSLANKTICEVAYNRQKKQGRVPRDCPNFEEIELNLAPWRKNLERLEKDFKNQSSKVRVKTDPVARCNARVKAIETRLERDYWRDKLRRFDMTADKLTARDGGLGGFKKRQLVDTGIMCSHAVELLKSVYPATFAVNGAATAFARKAWGLQGDEKKDRTEHTHHAVDAMVIAALTPARFTAICSALKDDAQMVRNRESSVCKPPCAKFYEKVRRAADEILVKHVLRQTTLRQSSKQTALAKCHPLAADPSKQVKYVVGRGDTVRGALHKDTFYGAIKNPESGKIEKVVRKSIVGPLKDAEGIVEKIVDPGIKAIVADALSELKAAGVKFIEPGQVKMPSGVPVNKVRIYTPTATNAQLLRNHSMPSEKDYKNPYYVTSAEGSNFRMAVFSNEGKYSVKVDNSLVWAQEHKKQDYIPYDQQPNFVGYIMPGTMALTHAPGAMDELRSLSSVELAKRLYKVVKFREDGLITFRRHSEARPSVVLSKELKEMGKHAAGESKIEIDIPHELLLISPKNYMSQIAFEGIHFRMMMDGSICFP